MCIFPELDLILGALPMGPSVRSSRPPPHPSVFAVEQTEGEQPHPEPAPDQVPFSFLFCIYFISFACTRQDRV